MTGRLDRFAASRAGGVWRPVEPARRIRGGCRAGPEPQLRNIEARLGTAVDRVNPGPRCREGAAPMSDDPPRAYREKVMR